MRTAHYRVQTYSEPAWPQFRYGVIGPAIFVEEDESIVSLPYDSVWPCETLTQANFALLSREQTYLSMVDAL